MIVYEIHPYPLSDVKQAIADKFENWKPRPNIAKTKCIVAYCDSNGRPYKYDSEVYTEEQIREIIKAEGWSKNPLSTDG